MTALSDDITVLSDSIDWQQHFEVTTLTGDSTDCEVIVLTDDTTKR